MFHCACGGDLSAGIEEAACDGCGRKLAVGVAGVVRIAETDVPWSQVPEPLRTRIHNATTSEAIVEAMLDQNEPWPQGLQIQLLHPAGAVAAALAIPMSGMNVLNLGTGWPVLASALASFGAKVTSTDAVLQRLQFEQLMHNRPAETAVHFAYTLPLPWQDGAFDRVFFDVGEVRRAGAEPAAMIPEVRRVLKSRGVLVVGVGRDAGVSAWRMKRLLRTYGLRTMRIAVPRPDLLNWKRLVNETSLPQEFSAEIKRTSRQPIFSKQSIKRILVAFGVSRWVPHDRLLVAQFRAVATQPDAVSEMLSEPNGGSAAIMRLTDARVGISGRASYVKLPLSVHQQSALIQEARNTKLARRTAFAPYVIGSVETESWNGVSFVRYPLLRERSTHSGEAELAIEAVLRAVSPGQSGPLDSTAFWDRLKSRRAARDAAEAGGSAIREVVLERLGGASVPIGPTHGDLHTENVMLTEGQRPTLVDWNRFELSNPLLLDAGYAAIEHHRRIKGTTFAEALVAFRDQRIDGRLAACAEPMLGGLSREEGTVLILLDRLVSYSLPRRRYKPWTLAAVRKAVQALEGVETLISDRGVTPRASSCSDHDF